MDLPIVNDTFIVFPYKMLEPFFDAVVEMETNPPYGVNSGMHNLYLPMVNQVGEDNVVWLDDEFKSAVDNSLYKLERTE